MGAPLGHGRGSSKTKGGRKEGVGEVAQSRAFRLFFSLLNPLKQFGPFHSDD